MKEKASGLFPQSGLKNTRTHQVDINGSGAKVGRPLIAGLVGLVAEFVANRRPAKVSFHKTLNLKLLLMADVYFQKGLIGNPVGT